MRIKLSKHEKIAILTIKDDKLKNPLINEGEFFIAVISLRNKMLIDDVIDYDTITTAKVSYFGNAYLLTANPTLRNPVDWWRIIEIIIMGVTTAATTAALFISCSLLK